MTTRQDGVLRSTEVASDSHRGEATLLPYRRTEHSWILQTSRSFLTWGTQEWMVYQGRSFLNRKFRGTTILGNKQMCFNIFSGCSMSFLLSWRKTHARFMQSPEHTSRSAAFHIISRGWKCLISSRHQRAMQDIHELHEVKNLHSNPGTKHVETLLHE